MIAVCFPFGCDTTPKYFIASLGDSCCDWTWILLSDMNVIVSLLLLSIGLSFLSNVQSRIQKFHLLVSSLPPTNVSISSQTRIDCCIASVIVCCSCFSILLT